MTKSPDKIIEDAYAEMSRGFYMLRKEAKYQEKYDAMGTVMNLLGQDRAHLRKTYKIVP